jgi:hypothetical protein
MHRTRRLGTVFAQGDTMEGFARGAVAGDLGERCTARAPHGFFRLDEQHPGSFTEHEAIAIGAHRSRSSGGHLVPVRGDDAHAAIASQDRWLMQASAPPTRIRSARSARIWSSASPRASVRARAAVRDDLRHAAQPECDRNFARQHAGGGAGHRVRPDAARPGFEIGGVLTLGVLDAGGAGADDDVQIAPYFGCQGFGFEARIRERFARREECERHDARDAATIAARDVEVGIEVGTSPATRQGSASAANSVIVRVALRPARNPASYAARPVPCGPTQPCR